jgi:hypothetical protein
MGIRLTDDGVWVIARVEIKSRLTTHRKVRIEVPSWQELEAAVEPWNQSNEAGEPILAGSEIT